VNAFLSPRHHKTHYQQKAMSGRPLRVISLDVDREHFKPNAKMLAANKEISASRWSLHNSQYTFVHVLLSLSLSGRGGLAIESSLIVRGVGPRISLGACVVRGLGPLCSDFHHLLNFSPPPALPAIKAQQLPFIILVLAAAPPLLIHRLHAARGAFRREKRARLARSRRPHSPPNEEAPNAWPSWNLMCVYTPRVNCDCFLPPAINYSEDNLYLLGVCFNFMCLATQTEILLAIAAAYNFFLNWTNVKLF
jgi:hypothetical protein